MAEETDDRQWIVILLTEDGRQAAYGPFSRDEAEGMQIGIQNEWEGPGRKHGTAFSLRLRGRDYEDPDAEQTEPSEPS